MFPFDALGLRPYLWIDESGKTELSKLTHLKSRQIHPDMVDDKEREQAEEASAAMNSSLRLLRDPWALSLNFCKATEQKSLPPTFAAEYFELQERFQELPKSDTAGFQQLAKDVQSFEQSCKLAHQELQKLWAMSVQRFTYSGLGDPNQVPWTEQDLSEIGRHCQQLKYLDTFFMDLKNQFGSLLEGGVRAHSN
jgi:hypothetical protein